MPGRIKHTEETVYRICDEFKGILERDNQEKRWESFRSSMHWDSWKIVYYRRKVLNGVTLFEKALGISRFETMVGKVEGTFGEENWKSNKEKVKKL